MNIVKQVKVNMVNNKFSLDIISNFDVNNNKISTPSDVNIFYNEVIRKINYIDENKESVIVLIINTKNYLKYFNLCGIGVLDCCLVYPTEVLKPVIVSGCNSLILVHNHPSGDINASSEDIKITRDIVNSSKLLGLKMLDHIIVGENNFNSLRESGQVIF